MRKRVGKTILFIVIAVISCLSVFYLYSLHRYYESDVANPPKSGQWKNDELNIVLDYDTGYATLYSEQETIICDILIEYNTPIIFLSVAFLENSDTCSLAEGTVVFNGEYEAIEKDRLCIREDETDKLYWFYLIDEGTAGDHSSS